MKSIVIIGSGLGGLTLGNLLVKRGHNVTILESHNSPGGYTAGFKRKGFYFESGTLAFESSSEVFKTMKQIGVLDKIDFIKHHFRYVSADFDATAKRYDDFKQVFYNAYPSSKKNLDSFFNEVDRMYHTFSSLMMNNKPPVLKQIGLINSGLKMINLLRKYGKETLSEFIGRHFKKDSLLYRYFINMGYPDMSAYILGGAFVTIFDDYWTVKSGIQLWADVLSNKYKENGGKLFLNSYVNKIITDGDKAVAVYCNGKRYDGDYIVSACDYKQTFLNLLDNKALIPVELLNKIRDNAVSEGIFTVYLGLKISNNKLKNILKSPHVNFFDEQDGKNIYDPTDEDFFKKISITLFSPSLLNAEHSPPDKSSLMIQGICPNNWMNRWGAGNKSEYKKLKEKVKNDLIDKTEKIIPGLREYIDYDFAATPLTYERYTHNTDGATSAWSWNPNNKFYKSFLNAYVTTSVKNLLISSCWATQIGGVPGALQAANKCAKIIK